MCSKQLRCRQGLIRNFQIDGKGHVTYSRDLNYPIPTRISGKRKFYKQVQLMRGGQSKWYYIHRLMAFSWLGNSPHLLRCIVDHSNGDSLNNDVNNLRWVTPTANQINKKCCGLVEEDGQYLPRIAGYNHTRYKTPDKGLCEILRAQLVQCYVRYNCRFPDNGSDFPHKSINKY
jgi:hypothetical protein